MKASRKRAEVALEAFFREAKLTYVRGMVYDPQLSSARRRLLVRDGKVPELVDQGVQETPRLLHGRTPQKLASEVLRALASGALPAVELRWIGGRLGYGLFASEPIAAGALVGAYYGLVCAKRPTRSWIPEYLFGLAHLDRSDFYGKVASSMDIDAEEIGNETRFINHAGDPNLDPCQVRVGTTWTPVFLAARKISAGEPLTMDYGQEGYWDRMPYKPIDL